MCAKSIEVKVRFTHKCVDLTLAPIKLSKLKGKYKRPLKGHWQ